MIADFVILLVYAMQVAANCAYGTSDFPREPQVPVPAWGYDYLQGPLNWYGLNMTANLLCNTGKNQSPIILDSSIPTTAGSSIKISIPDYPKGAEFENLGVTVEVVVNGSLVDSGKTYALAQFHFHTPSEHRIDREFYPMEGHFVFQSADKQISVVSIIIDLCEGKSCTEPLLDSVFSSISAIPQPGNATLTGPLQFGAFLSKLTRGNFWRYSGSLTTPPCSENVNFLLSQSLFYVDLRTWNAVKKNTKYNARYTQNSLGSKNLLQKAADDLSKTGNLKRHETKVM